MHLRLVKTVGKLYVMKRRKTRTDIITCKVLIMRYSAFRYMCGIVLVKSNDDTYQGNSNIIA